MEERAVDRQGVSKEVGIERTSDKTFCVTLGDKSRTYSFSTINVEEKIARNFGIPRENAQNIVEKAKKQSVLQNKIHNAAKKKAKAAPTVEAPKISTSKGLKR